MCKQNNDKQMLDWMKDLWEYPRSLTGHGVHDTLKYLQNIHNDLNIKTINSGTKVFDWEIPEEWNIYDAYIEHETGQRYAEFHKNNLHIMGYSTPYNKSITLSELLPHIYTQPTKKDIIPYVTSYYEDNWGFCMSEKEKGNLLEGQYHVFIDSEKKSGKMHYADLIIKGKSDKEIFFSTYICHPSMANNELSGPVLSTALIRYIKKKYKKTNYTYRFVFAPETIGAITYLSKNLVRLKKNVICGFNLSCVGDERGYSQIESRLGNTIADQALKAALIGMDNVKIYSFLDRGSDERQYCAPGVDLPFCGFCRTKYGEFPEYHTSADNFDVVTEKGLDGSFKVMKSIINSFEMGISPIYNVKCEPQLSKKGLYPSISKKGKISSIDTRMDVLAYADGTHNLFEIAVRIKKNLKDLIKEVEILKNNGLLIF
jgi:aminopeptidase-like protein